GRERLAREGERVPLPGQIERDVGAWLPGAAQPDGPARPVVVAAAAHADASADRLRRVRRVARSPLREVVAPDRNGRAECAERAVDALEAVGPRERETGG